MYINGTLEEIQTLKTHSENAHGNLAIFYDSLRRASEIFISLSDDDLAEIKRVSDSNPILKSMILNVTDLPLKSVEVKTNLNLPGYLTVNDVSELLDISTQMVRKHCADKKIKAWRTLGDSGEWRIEIEQYKGNPNFYSVVAKYVDRNQGISQMIATNEELTNQLRNAKARKHDPNYYHNDIERFNKLVDSSDE